MRRALILIAASTLIASCDFGRIQAEGRPVSEVWGTADPQLKVAAASSPLRADREVPLLSAPEVFAVYVPSRLDRSRDLMIGEHWVYFRLRDGEWFTEREREPELPASGEAKGEDLRLLRQVEGLSEAGTPWRGAKRRGKWPRD